MQTGLNINSLDYLKTLLDLFHSETPNFFTELKHGKKKKAEKMKEKEKISKEKAPFGFLYDFLQTR